MSSQIMGYHWNDFVSNQQWSMRLSRSFPACSVNGNADYTGMWHAAQKLTMLTSCFCEEQPCVEEAEGALPTLMARARVHLVEFFDIRQQPAWRLTRRNPRNDIVGWTWQHILHHVVSWLADSYNYPNSHLLGPAAQ